MPLLALARGYNFKFIFATCDGNRVATEHVVNSSKMASRFWSKSPNAIGGCALDSEGVAFSGRRSRGVMRAFVVKHKAASY